MSAAPPCLLKKSTKRSTCVCAPSLQYHAALMPMRQGKREASHQYLSGYFPMFPLLLHSQLVHWGVNPVPILFRLHLPRNSKPQSMTRCHSLLPVACAKASYQAGAKYDTSIVSHPPQPSPGRHMPVLGSMSDAHTRSICSFANEAYGSPQCSAATSKAMAPSSSASVAEPDPTTRLGARRLGQICQFMFPFWSWYFFQKLQNPSKDSLSCMYAEMSMP
mmetsp:Transcript_307/g.747  ORF Transcript_307/g.747 Transcript_307/m.747 type:complete len:219 (+) Transcript_307:380-1036(+)